MELQTEGPAYLAGLSFYEASSPRRCKEDDRLAFTTVGARHVFICDRTFLAEWRRLLTA